MTFSKELNSFGQASFSLNLEHPMFSQALADGSPVEDLFDYENLWEIRFDDQIVFQMLGTAVTDSKVNEAETRTATVAGAGIGKVLEWAQVYPKGFPNNITTKLETLKDTFSGDVLSEDTWKYTMYRRVISVGSPGSWQDAEDEREKYQKIVDDLTAERDSLQEEFNDVLAELLAGVKAGTLTADEKNELNKEIAHLSKRIDSKNLQIVINYNVVLKNNEIKTFIGGQPTEDDAQKRRLKITLPDTTLPYSATTSEPKVFVTSGTYDFESSGVSAAIEPAPSSQGSGGQVPTYFQVYHDPGVFTDWHISSNNFARMYTYRIGGDLHVVAEVSSAGEVTTTAWDYNVANQKYWRIREDNGKINFDTSPDNETWTRRFTTTYSWPTKDVVFQFGLGLKGLIGIAVPISAYMYDLNISTLPSTETAMQSFNKYLAQAQARGVIPFVIPTFTNTKDSNGVSWTGKLGYDAAEGTKLSSLFESLTQLQQADWIMEPNFRLNAYQRSKTDSITPPVHFYKDQVIFHEAGSQLGKERSRNRDNIANYIVGKNAAGEYAYTQDTTSISKYMKREAFVSAGTAEDLVDLATVLDSSLEELKDEKSSWKVNVAANQPGRSVFKDYNVGDWISIENISKRKEASVGIWRVVGIAINVATDATITVELTLQSRRELLIERLKQQVANLSTSSGITTNTKLGSAISAATLIEQAKLSGLKDVMVNNPVEGDVLTYSNGYWIPVAPGDTSIPNPPQIATVYTNVYYPADGLSTKGQADITWTVPTNIDGSIITDGHHFELRFRPDATGDYSATWLEGSQYDWDEVYTWGQPTIPPILNGGWQTIYVGWDEVTTVIQELTPGLDYNLQIRSVDSATPQHFSEWSDEYTFSVAVDEIAPAKPAPPVVASSYLSIQVTHYLGRADGGTFNLPPDLAYLEIHTGPQAFYPDETTRAGKVIADQGLIRSKTPVIQTFNLESTDDIYVRVIAVDKTGNKSAPSDAVASTINLIDDAHISDLTASKITAGTISSSIILSGIIKTAETGPRAEMNFEGFKIFSDDDDPTVSLLGSPDVNGNFLLIKDLEDPTATLASIDGLGRGSFQTVYANDNLIIDGDDLIEDIITPRGKGVISIGTNSQTIVGGGVNTERGFMEISFEAEESRTYMICAVTEWESDVANDRLVLRLRDFTSGNPVINNTWIQQSISGSNVAAVANHSATITYSGTFTPGVHRILLSFYCPAGVATVNPPGTGGVPDNITVFWVEDVGLPKTDTAIVNDAGVPAYQQTSTVLPPSAKREYTKTYRATWSATYKGNGQISTAHGETMAQGNNSDGLGDLRSICGFDYQQIMADTRGATIKACYITMYASHWYWNVGGSAVIGTHDYTGRPSTWSTSRVTEQRVYSHLWPKPGKRKVSLGTTIGNEFRTGVAKGIALGPTNGTKTQYGKINGNAQPNEPLLTIVYVQ